MMFNEKHIETFDKNDVKTRRSKMRLRSLRERKCLTQEEIAKKVSLSQNGYSSYESGRTEPSISTLCKLADFYDVSLDYLVGRDRIDDVGYLTLEQKKLVYIIRNLNEQNVLMLTKKAMELLSKGR